MSGTCTACCCSVSSHRQENLTLKARACYDGDRPAQGEDYRSLLLLQSFLLQSKRSREPATALKASSLVSSAARFLRCSLDSSGASFGLRPLAQAQPGQGSRSHNRRLDCFDSSPLDLLFCYSVCLYWILAGFELLPAHARIYTPRSRFLQI